MSMQSVLCIFSGRSDDANALRAAFNLTFTSHGALRVIHIAAPPILYAATIGADFAFGQYPGKDVGAILEAEALELSEQAKASILSLANASGVDLVEDGCLLKPRQAQASFRILVGPVETCLPKEGRSVDLVVLGYDSTSGGDLKGILTALFKTGSPVLAIPHAAGSDPLMAGYARTIAVAWDGSLTASRALRSAIPYLKAAENVYVISVEGMSDPQDIFGERDIVGYLASHGITAEFIHSERIGHSIGQIFLERAADLRADLLVMGAYGHGHIGEMILGGVSNYLLKHADIPLFLAH